MSGLRCNACGNKTRFDVFESKRVRAFHHFTLGGELEVEEEEVLSSSIEKIVCRWCGSSDAIVAEAAQGSPGPAEAAQGPPGPAEAAQGPPGPAEAAP